MVESSTSTRPELVPPATSMSPSRRSSSRAASRSASGSGEAWYVARKDMAGNTLFVVQGHDHPWLLAGALAADDAHWIAGGPPQGEGPLGAKTRYRQSDAPCRLRTDARAPGRFELEFDVPQWAVTPGQSAVLYRGEVCLGGGVIAAAHAASTLPA